jgi:PAS domain S-box-containing protein
VAVPVTDAGFAEHMVQQAPDAMLLVDGQGRIVFANAAVKALFGYRPRDLLGQPIERLVPERSRSIHERYRNGFTVAPSVREMGARIVTLSACRKDGTEFPAEIRLAPVRHAGDGFVLAAVRDVTDRRHIMDALRTAQAEADSANKTKSRFLATASHDLRQPLQTLQLLNAALGRKLSDATCLELLQRQQDALESMADLLNALLDITKLESGSIRPTLDVVALADVLADIRRQAGEVATAHGLTLDVTPTTECLMTDRVLLRQMLQNLVNNALQCTREGGVTIAVDRDAEHLIIEVADTGIGIPAQELKRIFDEYYRVDTPGTRRKGFGLGLTIVRQISRLLGYVVDVQSETGGGTTFTVRIPIDNLVEPSTRRAIQPGATADRSGVPKPGVLVIEDDAAVRDALELVLGLEGYPIRTANSAAAAEDIFARHGAEIDVVVSDYHLGDGRNGLELLEKMRVTASRDLPAVILSGDTSPVLASIASVSRVVLLRKPVDARRLILMLEELFGSAG